MNNLPVVLVVDDEDEFRQITCDKLKAKGFICKTAIGGEDAIAKAKELKPDIILMDVKMPDKDGIETTIELKQNPRTKDIKIIFLTNYGDPAATNINKRFSEQIGAADYFKKGGNLDDLAMKIRELLK